MTRIAVSVLALLLALAVACGPGPSPSPRPVPSSTASAHPSPSASASPSPAPSSSPRADICHAGAVVYCALNPAVTDGNVHQTICDPAWTKGLRPPVSLTNQWKQDELVAFHLAGTLHDYEGDHRMPEAALGGDPGASQVGGKWVLTDQTVTLSTGVAVPANFADEMPPSPNPKDKDELALHDLVCAGKIALSTAQVQLIGMWLAPFPAYLR